MELIAVIPKLLGIMLIVVVVLSLMSTLVAVGVWNMLRNKWISASNHELLRAFSGILPAMVMVGVIALMALIIYFEGYEGFELLLVVGAAVGVSIAVLVSWAASYLISAKILGLTKQLQK